MRPAAISLRIQPDGTSGIFGFTCPECSQEVNRPASERTVALLMAAGVEPTEAFDFGVREAELLQLPPEDLSTMPGAPAFTLDDVIAFHFLLEDDAVLAELAV